MKYLAIAFLLITGFVQAQENDLSKPFLTNAFKADVLERINTIALDHKDLTLNFLSAKQVIEIPYQSDFQFILPLNAYLVNYPSTEFSNLSGFFLGSYTTQSLHIGNKTLQSTYIFDTNGVLRSSEISIPFHKN